VIVRHVYFPKVSNHTLDMNYTRFLYYQITTSLKFSF